MRRPPTGALVFLIAFGWVHAGTAQSDPLPSWKDGQAKQRIETFVTETVQKDGSHFVPPQERIATFDNDGTLWVEAPMYTQLMFAFDRVRQTASAHPAWTKQQPFKGVIEGDRKAVAQTGEKGAMEIMLATSTGMTGSEFQDAVSTWMLTARDPKFHQPYNDLVYQPMIELLAYLRTNGFKTFIVSGGDVDFMRPWAEKAYGVPPEQVIGSAMKTQFEMKNGTPVLMRLPQIEFLDDGPGKPAAIERIIGRRPILAVGNSDGDLQMLEWTAASATPHLAVLIHHTDDVREYAYDRQSPVGKLDLAMDEATNKGWLVVSMKDDWQRIFAFQP